MGICHCDPTLSHRGNLLSGHPSYQAIEGKYFHSLTLYSLWPSDAISGEYSLVGDVPPGLSPTTPNDPTTLLNGTLGRFTQPGVLTKVLGEWNNTFEEKIFLRNYSVPGSDQGSVSISGYNTGTLVTRTYNFTVLCKGLAMTDEGPMQWNASESATLIVLKDWGLDSNDSLPLLYSIRDGRERI